MSVEWLNWAFKLPGDIKGPARLVAITLADVADEDGHSWWPTEKLCQKTAMSERALARALAALCETGYMTRTLNGKKSFVDKKTRKEIIYDKDKRPTLYALHGSPVVAEDRTLFESGRKQPGAESGTPSESPQPEPETKSGTPVEPKVAPRGVPKVAPNPSPDPSSTPQCREPVGDTQEASRKPALAEQQTIDGKPGGSLNEPSSETRRLCKRFAEVRMVDPQAIDPDVKKRDWIAAMTALVNSHSVRSVDDMLNWLEVGDTDKFWTAKVDSPKKLARLWNQIEAARSERSERTRLRGPNGRTGRGAASEDEKILAHAMADAALALEGA